MDSNIQFRQLAESEQQKASRALAPEQAEESDAAVGQKDTLRFRNTPVDNYLIGRNLIADANQKPTLFQTTFGRILTRSVSRGVFGAIAFTWAQNYSGRAMRNYSPDSIKGFTEWRRALFNVRSTSEIKHVNTPNTMQAIAKAYDLVAGEPIKFLARHMAPKGLEDVWANKAVLFRQRTMHHDPVSTLKPLSSYKSGENPFIIRTNGRSLGAEIVGVTADFAAASFGDATARNIIDTLDPNNKKARDAWKDYKGHFSLKNFGWDWTKRAWRIVSFNQGEDWAVALPYVYFIKWHRNVIDKFSPGFKLASDNPSWQAASDKWHAVYTKNKQTGVDEVTDMKWVGDFQKEGAWDLQARFTMYNVFTLMFRETYTKAGNVLMGWAKGDSWLPKIELPNNPILGAIEGAGNLARYGAKSFIKANLYMQPAVPTFWMFRTSQSKWQASPIVTNAQDGNGNIRPMIITKKANNRFVVSEYLRNEKHPEAGYHQAMGDYYSGKQSSGPNAGDDIDKHVGHRFTDDNVRLHPTQDANYTGPFFVWDKQIPNHMLSGSNQRSLFDDSRTTTLFGALTKPFGRASFRSGSGVSGWINNSAPQWVRGLTDTVLSTNRSDHKDPAQRAREDAWSREKALRTAVDASFAYTPYMITKAETALRWDTPEMDQAAYQLIDSIVSLDVTGTKKAIAAIGDLLVHPRIRDDSNPANVNPVDASLKPTTKIAANNAQHVATLHAPHRTLQ